MAKIFPGRMTHRREGELVVFMIGMRVNRFFAFRKWVPTAMAMNPMLRTLSQHPEKGFLGMQTFLNWRGVTVLQYWRSFDDLERFARSKEEPHLSAWRRFNKAVGTDGSVGIWHETYQVASGQYEAVYNNMPIYGLANATDHLPATGRKETARRRMGGESEPAVPTPA